MDGWLNGIRQKKTQENEILLDSYLNDSLLNSIVHWISPSVVMITSTHRHTCTFFSHTLLPICSGYPGNQWCHKTPALLIISRTFKLSTTVGRCVVVVFISSDILPKVKINVTFADVSLTLCETIWMWAQIRLKWHGRWWWSSCWVLFRTHALQGLPTLLLCIILQDVSEMQI